MSALAALPARRVVRAIADAARRWCDADFPPRVRALDAIAARTGYAVPAIEYALDRLFESLDARVVEATIANELGDLGALDGFVARAGRPRARALPVGAVCVISSRTTIGVAIVPAAFALCAKCDVVVKDREDHLVEAFFGTLREEQGAFAEAARAQEWTGESDAQDLATFGTIVAFGRDEALARIRARCGPEARFVGFGPKASAGYLTREALRDESSAAKIADRAVRDLVLYESEGCLNLHVLFVERGGVVGAARVAELLALAAGRAAVEFPIGAREPQTQSALASARATAIFREGAGQSTVFCDEATSYLIVADPPPSQAPFFLPRALGVVTVKSPHEAATYLRVHGVTLEALAVKEARADVVDMAIGAGAARIVRFGELQAPLASANHGGRARIADFVRWITDET